MFLMRSHSGFLPCGGCGVRLAWSVCLKARRASHDTQLAMTGVTACQHMLCMTDMSFPFTYDSSAHAHGSVVL
jgi:hypothetical protein